RRGAGLLPFQLLGAQAGHEDDRPRRRLAEPANDASPHAARRRPARDAEEARSRPVRHRADGAGRQLRHRRLFARRRGLLGGERPHRASGGGGDHRRPPALDADGHPGDRRRHLQLRRKDGRFGAAVADEGRGLLTLLDIAAALLVLTALVSYANQRWLKLPTTIGVMGTSLALSLALVALDAVGLSGGLHAREQGLIRSIDFSQLLMQGMLSLLLFAGALHVDVRSLRDYRWQVALLAFLGTAASTAVVGVALWFAIGAI